MVRPHSLVIIGGSLAGAGAAATLRAEGFDGLLVVVAEEPVLPYERPLLSREYLRGEAGSDKVFIHDADFYDDHEIELRLSTTAVAVEASAMTGTKCCFGAIPVAGSSWSSGSRMAS
jgi:3-phenylpropionate/trans-cinnamate dioxygenase ferredoxin reductase subunit